MSLIYLLFNSKVVSPQNVQLGTKMNYPFYVSRKLLYWGLLIYDVTNFPWLFDPSPCHHFFIKEKPILKVSLFAHHVNVGLCQCLKINQNFKILLHDWSIQNGINIYKLTWWKLTFYFLISNKPKGLNKRYLHYREQGGFFHIQWKLVCKSRYTHSRITEARILVAL